MSTSAFHVLIIGGGLGGLCLAQGLKKASISVAVYERERTPSDRLQGYRIHIEPQGNLALHACLPPDLFEAYRATAGSAGNGLAVDLGPGGGGRCRDHAGDGRRAAPRWTGRRVDRLGQPSRGAAASGWQTSPEPGHRDGARAAPL